MAKRRGNGEGSITRLPSGNWRGQVMDGYRSDGKKNVINFTASTKGEVRQMIQNYWDLREKRPKDSLRPKAAKTPFSEWADTWYADYQTQVQPSTYSNYKYTLKILQDYFGTTPIEDIRVMDVNRFHNYLIRTALSKSYLTKCRAMLIQVFDFAEANELITHNAARKSKAVKTRDSFMNDEEESKKDAFTDQEQALLLQFLPHDLAGHTIRVMIATGVRTQEILALMPSDIADDGSTISITKAVKTVNGKPVLGPPKSRKGKRLIPVPEYFRDDVLYLKHHAGNPYVWTSDRENHLYDVGSFRRRYYREIKKIPGVRALSPHCCRHTYISNLEKKGVPMEQIARLAGHSKITTTDGYLHTDIATLANAVSVLNTINA